MLLIFWVINDWRFSSSSRPLTACGLPLFSEIYKMLSFYKPILSSLVQGKIAWRSILREGGFYEISEVTICWIKDKESVNGFFFSQFVGISNLPVPVFPFRVPMSSKYLGKNPWKPDTRWLKNIRGINLYTDEEGNLHADNYNHVFKTEFNHSYEFRYTKATERKTKKQNFILFDTVTVDNQEWMFWITLSLSIPLRNILRNSRQCVFP